MKYVIDLLKEKRLWEMTRLVQAERIEYKQGIEEIKQKITELEIAIKILNEKHVKRSELIDFKKWHSDYIGVDRTDEHESEIVDMYLKSINSSEA